MGIERSKRAFSVRLMTEAAHGLLNASTLCAISTVSPRGRAHVNTAYFAWSPNFRIIWISHPQARHSRNLRADGTAAIAVFDSTQTWGRPDRGIQLFGIARKAEGAAAQGAEGIYGSRFPAFAAEMPGYRPYVFLPRRIKLFDEPRLGAGVFVTAKVGARGKLAWARTETYRSR